MAEPSSTPSRKREITRNAILDATSQIIAEKGIDSFTISEVAKRARINRALIYHYFGDRDNLIVRAIEHIVSGYEPFPPGASIDSDILERSVRMHIEHPELARFFFQMLLTGRPLPRGRERILRAIDTLERLKTERAPTSSLDPTFAVIIIVLAELAWAFSREEIARMLEIGVAEADTRFIEELKQAVEVRIQSLFTDA